MGKFIADQVQLRGSRLNQAVPGAYSDLTPYTTSTGIEMTSYGAGHHDVRLRRLDGVPRRTPGLDGLRRLPPGFRRGRVRLHNVAVVQRAVRRADFALRWRCRCRESLLHRDDHLQWLPDHLRQRRRCCWRHRWGFRGPARWCAPQARLYGSREELVLGSVFTLRDGRSSASRRYIHEG